MGLSHSIFFDPVTSTITIIAVAVSVYLIVNRNGSGTVTINAERVNLIVGDSNYVSMDGDFEKNLYKKIRFGQNHPMEKTEKKRNQMNGIKKFERLRQLPAEMEKGGKECPKPDNLRSPEESAFHRQFSRPPNVAPPREQCPLGQHLNAMEKKEESQKRPVNLSFYQQIPPRPDEKLRLPSDHSMYGIPSIQLHLPIGQNGDSESVIIASESVINGSKESEKESETEESEVEETEMEETEKEKTQTEANKNGVLEENENSRNETVESTSMEW